MKKMKTLFAIDRSTGMATDTVVAGSEWVLEGVGIATVKIDGTCCLIESGRLFKRYDAKPGRVPPAGFKPCEEAPDPVTGHWPGWLPVGDGPEDKFHRQAFGDGGFEDGTYELVGPKISSTTHVLEDGVMKRNGSVKNRYDLTSHELWKHGSDVIDDLDRSFEGIRAWLAINKVEGIVFQADGRSPVKVRRKDVGIIW